MEILDISDFDPQTQKALELRWPVKFAEYELLIGIIERSIFDVYKRSNLNDTDKILTLASLRESQTHIVRFFTRAIELQRIENAGISLDIFSKKYREATPYITALLVDIKKDQPVCRHKLIASKTMYGAALNRIRRQIKYYQSRDKAAAVTNLPELGMSYISRNKIETINFEPVCDIRIREAFALIPNEILRTFIDNLIGEIANKFGINGDIQRRLFYNFTSLFSDIYNIMEIQWEALNKYKSLSPTKSFFSGTPKNLSVLLSAHYRNTDRQVARFSHGGERGLFHDASWVFSEMLFCDHYFMHGKGEAELVEKFCRRVSKHPITLPKIFHERSERHWSRIEKTKTISPTSSNTREKKHILFFCSTMMVDEQAVSPTFKMGSVLTVEFQRWLLIKLKEFGFQVTVKPHPKGAQGKHGNVKLLSGTGARFHSGDVSIDNLQQFDCLIFDFAGTAFMDAIMTDRGVILIDTGLRKFSKQGCSLLSERVSIVQGHQNEQHLFRVDRSELFEAIDTVSSKSWSDEAIFFAEKYF